MTPLAPEMSQAKRLLDLLGMELLFSPDVSFVMHTEADLRLPSVRAARLQAKWWKLQKLAKHGRHDDQFKPQHGELAAQPVRAGPARARCGFRRQLGDDHAAVPSRLHERNELSSTYVVKLNPLPYASPNARADCATLRPTEVNPKVELQALSERSDRWVVRSKLV